MKYDKTIYKTFVGLKHHQKQQRNIIRDRTEISVYMSQTWEMIILIRQLSSGSDKSGKRKQKKTKVLLLKLLSINNILN